MREHLERWRREYDVESVLHVTAPGDALEPADLVMVHDALDRAPDWRAYLKQLAGTARKVLVLLAPNPDRIDSRLAHLFGAGRRTARGSTTALASVLWELGRVREHAYLDVPWGLDGAPASLVMRVARFHALVLDVRPRTRQARRRLLRTA